MEMLRRGEELHQFEPLCLSRRLDPVAAVEHTARALGGPCRGRRRGT